MQVLNSVINGALSVIFSLPFPGRAHSATPNEGQVGNNNKYIASTVVNRIQHMIQFAFWYIFGGKSINL